MISKYIAVLMTVYNRKEITLKCLEILHNQDLPDSVELDVYVTDDGCTDGTPDMIRKMYPSVTICEGNGSLYWNRGMYYAWEKASTAKEYDYYLWVNDDTRLNNNAVRTMIIESDDLLNESILVGAVSDIERGEITTYSGYDNKGNRISPNGMFQECVYFNGNIVLVPSSVYKIVGNLNYYYNHSLGDFDYGYRAYYKGVKSYVTKSYVGRCDRHNYLPKWTNPRIPFVARMKNFFSCLGAAPVDNFYYNFRYKGFYEALRCLILSFANCLFPLLFYRKNVSNNMYFQ